MSIAGMLDSLKFNRFAKELDKKIKYESEKAFLENDFEKINELRTYAKNKIFDFISKFKNEDEAEFKRLKLQRSVDMRLQSYEPINQIRIKQEKEIERKIKARFPRDKKAARKARLEMLKALEIKCRKQDPVDEMRSEMQKVVDEMWKNDDPKGKEKRNEVFPNGKPTLEQFLIGMVEEARRKMP